MIKDRSYYIKMAGREVFKNGGAVDGGRGATARSSSAGLTAEQVDLLIPHQANIRIIEATAEHARIPMERVFVNVDHYGNTSPRPPSRWRSTRPGAPAGSGRA